MQRGQRKGNWREVTLTLTLCFHLEAKDLRVIISHSRNFNVKMLPMLGGDLTDEIDVGVVVVVGSARHVYHLG